MKAVHSDVLCYIDKIYRGLQTVRLKSDCDLCGVFWV